MALGGEHFSIGGGKGVVKRSFRAPERFQIAYVWVEVSKENPTSSQWRPTLPEEGTASLSGDLRWKSELQWKKTKFRCSNTNTSPAPILFTFTHINRGLLMGKKNLVMHFKNIFLVYSPIPCTGPRPGNCQKVPQCWQGAPSANINAADCG